MTEQRSHRLKRPATARSRSRSAQRSTLNVQRGITLIELLVVIIIALIVAGIAVAAMFGAPERARLRATDALIAKLDKALAAHLDAFNGDLVRPPKPTSGFATNDDDYYRAGASAGLPDVDRRAPVIMRKRRMREEFPERFVEIHSQLTGSPSTWVTLDWTSNTIDPGHTQPTTLNPIRGAYLRKIHQLVAAAGSTPTHNPATESAACLYLILTATGRQGIQVSEDQFTSRELRDTDGDGIPEFVDAWGNPLRFYRWPVLNTPSAGTADTDPDDANHTLLVSSWQTTPVSMGGPTFAAEFESTWNFHLITDPLAGAYTLNPRSDDAAGSGNPRGFYYYPLIVSAGADGKFGYYNGEDYNGNGQLDAGEDLNANGTLDFELDPRQNPHERTALVPNPSAVDPEGNSLYDLTHDNITNHQLRAGGTRK